MATIPTEIITPERARDGRGRRLYTDERRQEIIAAYQASGLTQVSFARREGIKCSTFTAWLQGRRRMVRGGPPAPVRFLEARVSHDAGGVEVILPDSTRVRGASAGEVAAVVRALRR